MPKLFVRRQSWRLTGAGRLIVLIASATLIFVLGRGLCGFLAVTTPVDGQFLVVESWLPAYAYREAAQRFQTGGYQKVLVTGVSDDDWESGAASNECFAEKSLTRFGTPEEKVVIVTADKVERDRTFHSAMAVKRWLSEQGIADATVDVISIGPHARRSRLLFEAALGDRIRVGVIAIEDRRFNPAAWWRTSAGVRTVLGETIAYLYALLFSATN